MNNKISNIDSSILDDLITGRVEPYIYAFSTNTIPNYLKVGDTYRPVDTRINEWKKLFPNLVKEFSAPARIDNNTIFRDYAVHSFLIDERGRERLLPSTYSNIVYYSKEFFKNATIKDLNDAIIDIQKSASENSGKYQQYTTKRLPITFIYKRNLNYAPRPNQVATISNFKNAVNSGYTNLLMYAVMRFGKSFTAICCALEIQANESDSDGKNKKDENKYDEPDTLNKKLSTYFSMILFFAFLTDSEVKSLEDIIRELPKTEENKRIGRNIGLRKSVLQEIQNKMYPFILSKLDYKIQNINSLMRDNTLLPIERAKIAMNKFERLSSSEIVTPTNVVKKSREFIKIKILDIVSKQGEFSCILYKKLETAIRNNIYMQLQPQRLHMNSQLKYVTF